MSTVSESNDALWMQSSTKPPLSANSSANRESLRVRRAKVSLAGLEPISLSNAGSDLSLESPSPKVVTASSPAQRSNHGEDLSLDVTDLPEEGPSPARSPVSRTGQFSPFLASHFAVPVPDKILMGRCAFQSPITSKISGPFRTSSPLHPNSPAIRNPFYLSFANRQEKRVKATTRASED